MGTDGSGVTTLVAFMGCPLRCKYCLNEKCHEPIYETDGETLRKGIMMLSAQELYELVKIDNIYFQSTGGGVCFGGGEPTLYPDFIEEFNNLCDNNWKITLETCLRCSYNAIKKLSDVVDYWIVDIKSYDSYVYKQYTGKSSGVLQHLTSLRQCVPDERITIKVPVIENYNSEVEVDGEVKAIQEEFGFSNVVKARYTTSLK